MLAILALARRVQDAPPEGQTKLDLVGTVLSATGLGLAVFGVLRSSEWGWVLPKPDGPKLLGVSPVVWLIMGGLLVVWLFLSWQRRLEARGAEPLVRRNCSPTASSSAGCRTPAPTWAPRSARRWPARS